MIPFIIAGAVGFGIAKLLEKDTKKYAGGGSVKGIKKKAEKLLEDSINYRFKNTDMGSGWLFQLESPLNKSVFNLLEEQLYLDSFSPDDMGIENYDDLLKEEQDYYYEEWKQELFESSFEAFKEKCKKHLDDFIEYIQQAKEYQDEMNENGGYIGEDLENYSNYDEFYNVVFDYIKREENLTEEETKDICIVNESIIEAEFDGGSSPRFTGDVILGYLSNERAYKNYAGGGKTGEKSTKKKTIKKLPKNREPKMVRQYFDDSPYSYAGGGKIPNVNHKDIQGKQFTYDGGKFLIVDFPNKSGAWNKGASWRKTAKHHSYIIKLDDIKTNLDKSLFDKFNKAYYIYDDYWLQFNGNPCRSIQGTSTKLIDTLNYEIYKRENNPTYAGGGSVSKGYMVFNYTDDIYATDEVFKTKKIANDFIKKFRSRFSKQGYYRDNQMNKIDVQDIDLLVIPSDFNPFGKAI